LRNVRRLHCPVSLCARVLYVGGCIYRATFEREQRVVRDSSMSADCVPRNRYIVRASNDIIHCENVAAPIHVSWRPIRARLFDGTTLWYKYLRARSIRIYLSGRFSNLTGNQIRAPHINRNNRKYASFPSNVSEFGRIFRDKELTRLYTFRVIRWTYQRYIIVIVCFCFLLIKIHWLLWSLVYTITYYTVKNNKIIL